MVCVCVDEALLGAKEREQTVRLLIPTMHLFLYDVCVTVSMHSRYQSREYNRVRVLQVHLACESVSTCVYVCACMRCMFRAEGQVRPHEEGPLWSPRAHEEE